MPVEPTTLLTFIAAALVIVLSPGPDTLLILRYTIASGQRTGFATVTGVQLGLAVHTILAAVGLSLVIASSETMFRAIAIAGAAYLGWLAVQVFGSGVFDFGAADGTLWIGAAKAARDALLTNLLNPKVILLFLALMP
ncbi:MAG: LysE family translocator, partial [Alphaproteobacteria bacterium]